MDGRRSLTSRRRAALVLLGATTALTACTSAVSGHGSPVPSASSSRPAPSTSASSTPPGPPSTPAAIACPTAYAAPDPNRPRMSLDFVIAPGHRTVRGTEHISFTPDRPITELVFRLTANTAPTVAEGNRIVVTAARADHGAKAYRFSRANAAPSTQGGLLRIPFGASVPAGTTVTADLAFTLTLGTDSFDRFGQAGPYAYFASAQPLLSWQRGFGWHAEDLINFPAESATSEAMAVDLAVRAPAADTVIMSGDPAVPPAGGTMRRWVSHLASARDVSVAAGPFQVADVNVGSTRLRVGAPTVGLRDALVPEFERALRELSARFGPFPFPSLSVARLPAQGGGIEYPSSILMLDGSRLVAVHETAHQWFYGMVGDSQALHPWLDEAFAEYAEQLVDRDAPADDALNAPGPVDASTESYGHDVDRYYFTTYNKGAAALNAARAVAGPAKWDAALRCYVAANAWRIVVPADFARAIAAFPGAITILREAGALR
ncbi:MAG TPA: M1 family aminopeptidase [Jatrophihabitans sp.]|jgi:hypothetical protein|uniref:M1 family aminopeptidase n=1 Tax=Jatrophihabitans sp. TaxID=1932789 RepID=UPI002E0A8267|nr:M1 family aminopeptidase [Jatrophihabitans sp.]